MIISKKIITNKSIKSAAYSMQTSTRTVYRHLQPYIHDNYLSLTKGIITITPMGKDFFDLIDTTSKKKMTRLLGTATTPLINPKDYFNKCVYNLGDRYETVSQEKRAVLIKIIKKLKILNETREPRNIQILFELFSKPLKAKQNHLECIMAKYIRERSTTEKPIHCEYSYTLATLIDWYTCGWDKFYGYWIKNLEKNAPKKLKENADTYVKYFYKETGNKSLDKYTKRKFTRTIITDWYFYPTVYVSKIKKIKRKESQVVIETHHRNQKEQRRKDFDMRDMQRMAFKIHWDTLPLDKQEILIRSKKDRLVAEGMHPRFIKDSVVYDFLAQEYEKVGG